MKQKEEMTKKQRKGTFRHPLQLYRFDHASYKVRTKSEMTICSILKRFPSKNK